MVKMIWNPATGKFEPQYAIPMPPREEQPPPAPPPEDKPWSPPFDTSKPAPPPGTHQLTPTTPVVEGPPKEQVPKELIFKTRVEDIKSRLQYHRLKDRIKPDETYHVQDITDEELAERRRTDPNYIPSYRVVVGSQLLSEYGASYQEYQEALGKERMFWKKGEREWHPGTEISKVTTKTGIGYEVRFPYAGAEKYGTYKKRLETDLFTQMAVKLTSEDILGIPSFVESQWGSEQKAMDIQVQALHKIITEPVLTAVQSPVAQFPWYFVGGIGVKVGLGYTAGKLAARPIASVLATKIIPTAVGGAMLTHASWDIKQTFERGDIGRAAGKLTGLGMAVVGFGVGYKLGAKVTFKGLTPKQLGYAKALKPVESKIDFAKLPVLKQMQLFKEYHVDIRLARGMKFGLDQPSYGKLPAYLGRQPYGKSDVYITSTLQQMKGTLVKSGFRGGDPLKAAMWKQYYSYNLQPKLAPRFLSALKYKFDPTGKGTISAIYDVKWGLPKLATGEMPSRFQISQVPVKVTGYKITKGFKLERPPGIDKVTSVVTSKTGTSVTPSKTGLQTVVSTQLRSLRVTWKRGLTLRELEFLESLKPPYETYVYPTGTRIGVQFPVSTGKIVFPTTGLLSERFSRNLYKDVFGEKYTRQKLGFIQLLKGGQRQITDVSTKQIYNLATGMSTALGTMSLSLQKTLLGQETMTETIQKQAVLLKQVTVQETTPIVFPSTPITHKPSKPIHTPIALPYIPLPSIHGRGRRFLDLELYGKKYKFRETRIADPWFVKKTSKKKKKKGGKKK